MKEKLTDFCSEVGQYVVLTEKNPLSEVQIKETKKKVLVQLFFHARKNTYLYNNNKNSN